MEDATKARANRAATEILQQLPPTYQHYSDIHRAVAIGYAQGLRDGIAEVRGIIDGSDDPHSRKVTP